LLTPQVGNVGTPVAVDSGVTAKVAAAVGLSRYIHTPLSCYINTD